MIIKNYHAQFTSQIRFWLRAVVALAFSATATAQSAAQPKHTFMMLSSYNLEPYNQAFIENNLREFADHRVTGILYASPGGMEKLAGLPNERLFNTSIYDQAIKMSAPLWLQVRVYDNNVQVAGEKEARTVVGLPAVSSG